MPRVISRVSRHPLPTTLSLLLLLKLLSSSASLPHPSYFPHSHLPSHPSFPFLPSSFSSLTQLPILPSLPPPLFLPLSQICTPTIHVTTMWLLPILKHATCHEQFILHDLHDLITSLRAALGRADYGDGLQHKCKKEGVRECVCRREKQLCHSVNAGVVRTADNAALMHQCIPRQLKHLLWQLSGVTNATMSAPFP